MVNMENYEEYMLLYADNELSKEQEQALLAFVKQHPELQKELDAYAATRLVPDEAIVFAGKEQLMKTAPGGRSIWLGSWKTYAAAAVVLFAVLFFVNRNNNGEPAEDEQMAIAEQPVSEPVKEEMVQQPVITDTVTGQVKEEVIVKKLQSNKPVNAVAVKQPKQKQITEQREPVIPQPQQVPQPPREEVIVKAPQQVQKQPEQQAPVVVKQPETEKAVIAPQPEKPANQMPAEQKKKRSSFVASVINDKADGLNGIGEAVNEKVMMAKAIRNKAKDTDITFKIGKIEILTVRL